jgi:hypothetical protein
MKYIITGDVDEVMNLAGPAREEGRFMSDTSNLDGFKWYPLSDDTHVLEVWTEGDTVIDPRELAILTREYSSLTIGIVEGIMVKTVISEGEVEELD